ncbi:Senescence regulator S40 [Arabidopsis thaliana x Arabidopsis arenosa]|uniref:Senescence regulator S40 n=1 Tax=Arabidopsis thaliana x Arabidopsis arenosa TaxID=1240361 RepID=A0A8T2C2W0_9BRAS|nr:Senescence regulator S40 [Arabidopsis thaliana x Arabidopsis arenosa]
MSEEFDESEIIFSDNYYPVRRREDGNEKENRPVGFRENSERLRNKSSKRSKTTSLPTAVTAFSSSLPVNIPMRRYSTEEEYSDDDGGRRMIPPHLIVGRRIEGGQMAFSVCTGNGRTLKGRDLSRVRNSVLRLTGFLEA